MANTQSKAMQIGQISRESGVSIDTIRFYERSRLLQEPSRTRGGFRLYSRSDLSTLQFIRSLQTLGFSLSEIREFLSLRKNDREACSEVRGMLDQKLVDIQAKQIALAKVEAELKSALKECDSQLKGRREKRNGQCPVLTTLQGPENESAHEN
jgi:DNA-binding transcriptional MerR regulator